MGEYIVKNTKETARLAKKFAKTLKGGERILLVGDLGAGKTTFTKYLAKALGVKDEVTSPTFTIQKEYLAKKFKVYHFDMYRVENVQETFEFGFDEIVSNQDKSNIVLIEWGENVKQLLNGEFYTVEIQKIDENSRRILIGKINENSNY